MKESKNRLLLVAHMIEVIRLDIEQRIGSSLSAACEQGLRIDQVEMLGFCCTVVSLLENTQALLCETNDAALAALAPHRPPAQWEA